MAFEFSSLRISAKVWHLGNLKSVEIKAINAPSLEVTTNDKEKGKQDPALFSVKHRKALIEGDKLNHSLVREADQGKVVK